MKRRQTLPREWLIVDQLLAEDTWHAVRLLPRGSGILILGRLSGKERRRLRRFAASHNLEIVDEAEGDAARVHNLPELRAAMLRRTPLILLSPIYATSSHPDWRPIPRMRAAALARLGHRRLLALGGMNRKRYANVAPLGFIGWAGISAFRT